MAAIRLLVLAAIGLLASIWGVTLWLLQEDIQPRPVLASTGMPAASARLQPPGALPSRTAPTPVAASPAAAVAPVPLPPVAAVPSREAASANPSSPAPPSGQPVVPVAPSPGVNARPRAVAAPPPPSPGTPAGGFVAIDPFADGGPAPVPTTAGNTGRTEPPAVPAAADAESPPPPVPGN